MCRHRIPDTTWFQFCHTHLQLAGRKNLIDDHLVDVTVVRHFQRTHSGHNSVSLCYFFIRIVTMCSRRVKIEFSRILGIFAFKCHFTVTGTQIKGFLKIKFENSLPSFYNTRSAHIEDTHFATSQKERSFQRIDCFQHQYFACRHSATHNHTVVHRIHHIHFVRSKHLFNQKVTTDTFRIILLCIFRMRSITQFIICFHLLIQYLLSCYYFKLSIINCQSFNRMVSLHLFPVPRFHIRPFRIRGRPELIRFRQSQRY